MIKSYYETKNTKIRENASSRFFAERNEAKNTKNRGPRYETENPKNHEKLGV